MLLQTWLQSNLNDRRDFTVDSVRASFFHKTMFANLALCIFNYVQLTFKGGNDIFFHLCDITFQILSNITL